MNPLLVFSNGRHPIRAGGEIPETIGITDRRVCQAEASATAAAPNLRFSFSRIFKAATTGRCWPAAEKPASSQPPCPSALQRPPGQVLPSFRAAISARGHVSAARRPCGSIGRCAARERPRRKAGPARASSRVFPDSRRTSDAGNSAKSACRG